MPLKPGSSKEVLSENISELVRSGKKLTQAVAIAMRHAAKSEDKSSGRFYTSETLSEHMAETPEGFLVCYDVPITRVGEFRYLAGELKDQHGRSPVDPGSGGVIRIQRDEDEVFSDVAISSFEGKPVTINHPGEFVNPDNWRDLTHGVVQNVRRGTGEKEDLLLADLCLTTKEAIELVKGGLRQISCGYDAQYEQIEPGLGRQCDIVGNHLALVSKGRAGSRCAIMDEDRLADNSKSQFKEVGSMSGAKTRKLLNKLLPKLNLSHVTDSDLEMAEEIPEEEVLVKDDMQELVDQAKGAAAKAVEAAKEAVEAVQSMKNGDEPSEDEVSGSEGIKEKVQEKFREEIVNESSKNPEDLNDYEDEPVKDSSEEITIRLDKLEAFVSEILAMLVDEEEPSKPFEPSEDQDQDEEEEEEPSEDEEGEEEEEEEPFEDEEGEEEEEEDVDSERGESRETMDALWRDLKYKADIIAPGYEVRKPNGKMTKKALSKIKRRVLRASLTKDHAGDLKHLFHGRDTSKMTRDSIDALFDASSLFVSKSNDRKLQKRGVMRVRDMSSCDEIAALNTRYKEYWNRTKR